MISTILQDEPRRKIWLYFLDLRLRYALILLFLGLVLAEWTFGKLLLLAGLTWVLGALAVGRIRPSDQELDELLSRDIEWVTEKATRSQQAQGERRAPPLALLGPVERDAAAPARFTRPRTGRDGGRRSPVNRVVVLLPMEDRLGIYSCHHDSLDNLISHVSAEEHHYRDVGSVFLEKDFETQERGAGRPPQTARATQVLSLELTTGRRLSYPAAIARSVDGEAAGGPSTGLDQTLHAIQTLLRDYR